MNYYGQAGATTVEIREGKLLVRHFLTGQLEIYRGSGETTLVTPDGRRIEVVRDKSGSVRVEMFVFKFFIKPTFQMKCDFLLLGSTKRCLIFVTATEIRWGKAESSVLFS